VINRWRQILIANMLLFSTLLLSGCELPHGPMYWVPLRKELTDREILPIIKHHRHCRCGLCRKNCQQGGDTQSADAPPPEDGSPDSGQLQPPWPRYLPVPTRPAFESRDIESQ
jgi:hypothetical protein